MTARARHRRKRPDGRWEFRFSRKEWMLLLGGVALVGFLLFLFGLVVGRSQKIAGVEALVAEQVEARAAIVDSYARELERIVLEETEPRPESDVSAVVESLTFPEALRSTGEFQQREGEGMSESSLASSPGLQRQTAKASTPAPATGGEAEGRRKNEKAEGASQPRVKPADTPKAQSFAVQVSSFRREEEAVYLRNILIEKGYPAYIYRSTTTGRGVWYRVRIGEFSDRKEAEQYARRVGSGENLPAFVARLP